MEHDTFLNGYALLIGIGADLPVTAKDATAVKEILINPNHAAYSPDRVHLLVDIASTRSNILDTFDTLIKQVNQNLDSTVIIYYSGHGGISSRTGEYFLVPYDYNPENFVATSISGSEFTRKIEAIKSRKLVVFLDCCHAGGILQLKEGESLIKSPMPPEILHILEGSSGRVIIVSSREEEYSYTGTPFSIFTTCLIEALQGKASTIKDGYARILDILIYLFDQVPKRAAGSQHPFVKKILDLGDNFPLCYYAAGNKYLQSELQNLQPNVLSQDLTDGKRRRLRQKHSILLAEWDTRAEKIKKMREDLAIEATSLIKFQLEKQIIEEESKLSRLSADLDEIENILN
jgi:hypothetical protein